MENIALEMKELEIKDGHRKLKIECRISIFDFRRRFSTIFENRRKSLPHFGRKLENEWNMMEFN